MEEIVWYQEKKSPKMDAEHFLLPSQESVDDYTQARSHLPWHSLITPGLNMVHMTARTGPFVAVNHHRTPSQWYISPLSIITIITISTTLPVHFMMCYWHIATPGVVNSVATRIFVQIVLFICLLIKNCWRIVVF